MQFIKLQVTAHFLRLECPEYNTVNVTSSTIFVSALMILFLFFLFPPQDNFYNTTYLQCNNEIDRSKEAFLSFKNKIIIIILTIIYLLFKID